MKHLSELHDVNSDIKRLWAGTDIECSEKARGSLIPLSTDQDVGHLRESLDQLNMALEKANRRINRLLGEKKQLSVLLERRDEKVEQLNRELGRYASAQVVVAARNGRVSRFQGLLATTLASVVGRINNFLSVRPEADKTPVEGNRSDVPTTTNRQSRLVARHKADIGQQVVAVLLFGLPRNEIEQLLPTIQRDCSAKRMVPLCLIDMDAFELMRERGLIFEYLPCADDRDRFDSALNWDLYIQRRLALIRRKWAPVRLIAFGAPAMKTLTLWSSSPFEDTQLPVASSALPAPM
ncbi:MAG: hypothetical protein ACR2RF_15845 [Geminicoccaceae bacterium]